MKIDDKILREFLQRKLKLIREHPRTALRDVENWMAREYNIKHGDAVGILNGAIPIETLNYDMLYKLMKSIHDGLTGSHQNFDLSDLSETKYFTDIEIEEFSKPMVIKEYNDDITFKEWVQIAPDQFVTKATIDEIVMWRNLNKIRYNPDTQRDMTIRNSKGIEIKVVTLNRKSVREIYQLMTNDDFIPDDLTLNINTDININDNQLPYVSNNNLIVPLESLIDIIDGFHRYYTMCTVKDANPDWEFTCIINIVMWDTEKANRFMLQRDKKNHLSDRQTTRIDKSSEVNYVINRLNNSSRFHWNGKVDDSTHYKLNNIITDIFNPTTREDSVLLYRDIEENINLLIEKKSYFDKKFTKEEWFIYLYLIKKSKEGKLDYIDLCDNINIGNIVEQIDFKNKPNKRHYRLIDSMLERVVDHV